MSETKVKILLQQWGVLIDTGEESSKTKASEAKGGLNGRIKRTVGLPVIFDFKTYDEQVAIQKELCKELPQWSDVISSQPEIMDGYPWTRGDFIELYFEHFRLVVSKLHKITRQQNTL